MKLEPGTTVLRNGQLIDGTGASAVADACVIVTDDPLAVLQGGALKAGRLAQPASW